MIMWSCYYLWHWMLHLQCRFSEQFERLIYIHSFLHARTCHNNIREVVFYEEYNTNYVFPHIQVCTPVVQSWPSILAFKQCREWECCVSNKLWINDVTVRTELEQHWTAHTFMCVWGWHILDMNMCKDTLDLSNAWVHTSINKTKYVWSNVGKRNWNEECYLTFQKSDYFITQAELQLCYRYQ